MSFKIKFKYGDEEHQVQQVHKGPIKTGNVFQTYNNPQYETIQMPRQSPRPSPQVKPPAVRDLQVDKKQEEVEIESSVRMVSSRTNEQGQEQFMLQATKFHVEPKEQGNVRYTSRRQFIDPVDSSKKPGSPIARLEQHKTAETLPENKSTSQLPSQKEPAPLHHDKIAQVILQSKMPENAQPEKESHQLNQDKIAQVVLQQSKQPEQAQSLNENIPIPSDKVAEVILQSSKPQQPNPEAQGKNGRYQRKPSYSPKKFTVEQVRQSDFQNIQKKEDRDKEKERDRMRVSARGIKDGEVVLKAPRFSPPKKSEGDIKHTTKKEYVTCNNNKYEYKEIPVEKQGDFTGCFSCFRSKNKGVKVQK